MADSKKYDGSQWEHSLRKLTTATEAVENPLYSDGTAITAYTLKGNEAHQVPQNPVMLNGVGNKTANLFDYHTMALGLQNTYLDSSGTELSSNDWNVTTYIPCDGTTFTLYPIGGNTPAICLYDENKQFIVGKSYNTGGAGSKKVVTITSNTTAKYIRFTYCISIINPETKDDITALYLLEGSYTSSTIPPFEPYGYKIPISSAGQTIDIYIGDLPLLKSLNGTAVDEINNGTLIRRVDSDGSVLPTPTTTQITMPSIPTTDGANTITVDTTVQPSEFSATWTGWHDSTVKEWDGSDWQ